MLENVWFILIFTIVTIILSTDPKASITGSQNDQLNTLFSSTSDSQKFVRMFTWLLIATFYTTTLLLSYYS